MICNKFKETKTLDLEKGVKNYLAKHYDYINFDKIYAFNEVIANTRKVIANIHTQELTFQNLKNGKDNIITYINMLNLLRSKFNFGNDDYSLKVEFSWKDTLNGDYYYSNNLNLELYSVLYNLGIVLFQLGKTADINDPDLEESKHKEAIKNFQYAAWVFDKIKNEIPNAVPPKEVSPDLSPNNLTYNWNICCGYAQIYILELAAKKNLDISLQAQLSRGVFDLLTASYNIAKESLAKLFNEETRIFLNNRRFFYYGMSWFKQKQFLENEFKRTAAGYGKQISTLALALEALASGETNMQKIAHLVDTKFYIKFKEMIKAQGEEMYDKNTRIYFDQIPDVATLPKIEKVIKGVPLQLPDDLSKPVEGSDVYNDLVPREARSLINNYKKQMLDYVSAAIENYENEGKMLQFLGELGLPGSLDSCISGNDISDGMWKRISDIQVKGGTNFLLSNIDRVEKTGEEVNKRIQDFEIMLQNEEQEDGKLRQLYQGKWNRQASNQLNFQYFQTLQDYKSKLAIARSCDLKIKEQVQENIRFFELLNVDREVLRAKIPVKTDSTAIKSCEEAKTLITELENFDKLKVSVNDLVAKIYQTLDEDNIIPQMLQVVAKKTTEQSVFSENKSKYENMLKELESLSGKINEAKKALSQKNEAFLKVRNTLLRPNEQNEKFFKDLDSYINTYLSKMVNLTQGSSFYNDFSLRLDELHCRITDFLLARDIEKNDIMKSMTSGQFNNRGNQGQGGQFPNQGQYGNQGHFGTQGNQGQFGNQGNLGNNPNWNVVTDMNYQYKSGGMNFNQQGGQQQGGQQNRGGMGQQQMGGQFSANTGMGQQSMGQQQMGGFMNSNQLGQGRQQQPQPNNQNNMNMYGYNQGQFQFQGGQGQQGQQGQQRK